MRTLILATVVTFTAISCSPIPKRFTLLTPRTSPHHPICAYDVTAETAQGFDLETLWKYSAWNPDQAVRAARICYQNCATATAAKRAKKIEPIGVADMNVAITPNANTGGYAVYVTGKVRFGN